MSASSFVRQADRHSMCSKGLTRFDRCVCHPRAWGLKKGLRRGRRRLDLLKIREGLKEVSYGV